MGCQHKALSFGSWRWGLDMAPAGSAGRVLSPSEVEQCLQEDCAASCVCQLPSRRLERITGCGDSSSCSLGSDVHVQCRLLRTF